MRTVAWGLVTLGLAIGLSGEVYVILGDLLALAPPQDLEFLVRASEPLSIWQPFGIGGAIACLGGLLLRSRSVRMRYLGGPRGRSRGEY